MFSPYQYWTDLYQLLTSPKLILFGGAEWLLSWINTRRWVAIASLLPILIVLGYSIGCSVYLRWIGPGELIMEYWGYIEKDSADKSTLLRSESLMEKDPDQEDPDIDETKQKEPESPELALTAMKRSVQ